RRVQGRCRIFGLDRDLDLSPQGPAWRGGAGGQGVKKVGPAIGLLAAILSSFLLAVYFPQSLFAFLLFEASLIAIYYSSVQRHVKLWLGTLMLLWLMPILGFINGYYLEVAIQIGIFVALALGLNIVVGFVGLLNLGFVAFYAIGAYLW